MLRRFTRTEVRGVDQPVDIEDAGDMDGRPPRWRGVSGDDGRLLVLIAYNNDVMDGWQWADDPRYPAEEANLALRLGVNVAMYAMTH